MSLSSPQAAAFARAAVVRLNELPKYWTSRLNGEDPILTLLIELSMVEQARHEGRKGEKDLLFIRAWKTELVKLQPSPEVLRALGI